MRWNRIAKAAAVLAVVLVVGVIAGAPWLLRFIRSRDPATEASCVGVIINLKLALFECLEEGSAPVSDETTRRGSELNAVPALGKYAGKFPWKWYCATRVVLHGEDAGGESYRMPDWTVEQWKRGRKFYMEIPARQPHASDSYHAPAIWDTEPVHGGRRTVLFLDGVILRGVPESLFQKLRRASEEFARKPSAGPSSDNP
jgi:prepilin-type processing-associated H-X9-DG protein